jgi:double-stranded uracil-DNA glycosylase
MLLQYVIVKNWIWRGIIILATFGAFVARRDTGDCPHYRTITSSLRSADVTARYPFQTLPDYLAPNLDLVLIGINPGLYSVEKGHYFARSTSRFWPAFSRSRLSEKVRLGLGTDVLSPVHDRELRRFGIGLTDLVKRPSANASEISPEEFAEWVPRLRRKLQRINARVACFHGLTAYRPFLKHAWHSAEVPVLGLQTRRLGETRLYVVPNPSPANAHFTVGDQTMWYDRLAGEIAGLDVNST